MRFRKIIHKLLTRLIEHLPAVRMALKRPFIFIYSICRLWKLRAVVIISIVFDKHKSKKLFGLIKEKNESHELAYQFGIYVSVLLVISVNCSLLILNISKGIKSAGVYSKRCEDKADMIGTRSKYRTTLLYILASQLVIDPECQVRIKDKTLQFKNEMQSSELQTGTHSTLAMKASSSAVQDGFIDAEKRYRLIGKIGQGAMGVVKLATDQVLNRKVAIKELPPYLVAEEQTIQRFKQEATALARLSHPHIVQVYDLVIDRDRIFMVLEYVKGQDLAKFLKENGPLGIDEAVRIVSQIAAALATAHDNSIVHRDIKPANILLTESMEAKITDFGIARLSTNSSLTQEGQAIGSPPYMSPEQCSGNIIDSRTDIYSLGITFYELLTGSIPFEGDIVSILSQHLTKEPTPPSKKAKQISPEIDDLILMMLEKDVEQRIQSANELTDRLSHITQRVVSS